MYSSKIKKRKVIFGILSAVVILTVIVPAFFAYAASITISSDVTSIAPGGTATITAKTDRTTGLSVSFSLSAPGAAGVGVAGVTASGASFFSGSPCTPTDPGPQPSMGGMGMASYYSCSVKFSNSSPGTYQVSASITVNGQKYFSNTISINVAAATPCGSTSSPGAIVGGATAPGGTGASALGTGVTQPCQSSYNLLAPLKCDSSTPGCVNGELTSFNPAQSNALSKYINIVIKTLIGIAAVLAVIMIVMGGIEYMTSELISSKEEGRHRITNAVIGLLIALGAYLILYTINPDLLNKIDIQNEIETAAIGFEEAPPVASDFTTVTAPTGAITGCSQGIVKASGFNVCGGIADSVNKLIADAKKDGITLGGWSYRSTADQIRLRQKNGCPDIMNSPPSQCKVPTAKPGTSNHEKGLAIDFTCNGASMAGTNCFKWLQANASKYGLYNYKKEPWHWSVDGR